MPNLLPIFKKAYWSLVGLGLAYVVFLLLLTNPAIQRNALYAHKIHTGYWDNLKRPEASGFGSNQVIPFYLLTPDGEKLYGWHILPLDLFAARESELRQASASNGSANAAIKLLKEDPESRVVIYFHGNAGHVAQGHRPSTYRSLTSASPKIHIFTIDYRGFGLSTGSPSESGLIVDGIALVEYVLSLGISPSRIALVGQSLGTAVTTAVALHFADSKASADLLPKLSPPQTVTGLTPHAGDDVDFAAVILVAAFPSLPKLLLTYRIAGIIPVLSPLRSYHKIRTFFLSFLKDTWNTEQRLAALTKSIAASPDRRLKLHLLHARDDWEIPWLSSEENFQAATGALEVSTIGDGGGSSWTGDFESSRRTDVWSGNDKRIWLVLEVLRFGGHNQIVSDVPVAIAVLTAFGLVKQ